MEREVFEIETIPFDNGQNANLQIVLGYRTLCSEDGNNILNRIL